MNKLFIILALLVSTGVQAQYRPQHTQYLLNNYLLNPAITGIEEYVDVQMGYRRQWTTVEGAPQTLHLTVHGPLGGKSNYEGLNELPTNRRLPSRSNDYYRPKAHHGLGGVIMADRVGPFERNEVQLSYAYHLPIARNTTLSAGLAGGWAQHRLNPNEAILTNPDDPVVLGGQQNVSKPLLSLGMWAYGPSAYVGASMTQVFGAEDESGTMSEGMWHTYVTAGYWLELSSQLALQPSALLRISQGQPVAYDASARLILQQRIWVGAAYRSSQEVSVLAGLHINELLSVGYAYDTGTGDFARYTHGSHEVILNVRLSNRQKDFCPQYLW